MLTEDPPFSLCTSPSTSMTSIDSEVEEEEERDYESLVCAYTRSLGSKVAFVELIHKAKSAPKELLCDFFDHSTSRLQTRLTFRVNADTKITTGYMTGAIRASIAREVDTKTMQLRVQQLKMDYGTSVRVKLESDEIETRRQHKQCIKLLEMEINRLNHLEFHIVCDLAQPPQCTFSLNHIDEHPILLADWVYKWVTGTVFGDETQFQLIPIPTTRIILTSFTVPNELTSSWEEYLLDLFQHESPRILSRSSFIESDSKDHKTSYMVIEYAGTPIEGGSTCKFEILSQP